MITHASVILGIACVCLSLSNSRFDHTLRSGQGTLTEPKSTQTDPSIKPEIKLLEKRSQFLTEADLGIKQTDRISQLDELGDTFDQA